MVGNMFKVSNKDTGMMSVTIVLVLFFIKFEPILQFTNVNQYSSYTETIQFI